MKNIFVISCLLFSSTQLLAQKPSRLFVTLQSGINLSKYYLNKNDGNVIYGNDFKNITSFNIGANINYGIDKHFLFQTGFGIEGKGGFAKSFGIWFYEQSTIHTYYLEIPFNLLYNRKIKNHLSVFVGSGISTSFGLFGQNSYNGSTGDLVYSIFKGKDNIKFGKSLNNSLGVYSNLKQFDYGINILGGAIYKKFSLQCQYNFGMQDISMQSDNRGKNRILSFSIGYRIN